jgi:uncharacterized Ntn-hydrolase superfamily protein
MHLITRRKACVLIAAGLTAPLRAETPTPPKFGTFSIVARDPETGELGVAVQSRVVAVGAVVPYAKAGIGDIATQAFANPRYGSEGLKLLGNGNKPQQTIDSLTKSDPQSAERQLGVISATGETATFTGKNCMDWAGGLTGENHAVQGNILTGPEVVDAMSKAFLASNGNLADRLIDALAAGQAAGGDKRGQQAAALLVVRDGWGYGGANDRYIDLRVDDHPQPITELSRIQKIHHQLFGRK